MAGVIAFFAFGTAAIFCVLAALWIARSGVATRTDRVAAIVALGLTAAWGLANAALGIDRPLVDAFEVARNLAWLFVVWRMFGNDGRDESLRVVRPLLLVLGFVEMLQVPLVILGAGEAQSLTAAQSVFQTAAVLRALLAVGVLTLLHNLYAGASTTSRRFLSWNAGALAVFWGWELNYYFVAFLTGQAGAEMALVRAALAAAFAGPFALGFHRAGGSMAFRPSRAVTFQTLSLVVIGAYLLVVTFAADAMAANAGELGRVVRVTFLAVGVVLALLWLPSERLRRWMRVKALMHLFKHRYDYRSEWIRFTHTIGRSADGGMSLHERAIQSLADIADCSAGLLIVPDEDGCPVLAARWRWPNIDVPAQAMPVELARILERKSLILDLTEVHRGIEHHGELTHIPSWLRDEADAWAAVPLIHAGRLVGVVVLGRPHVARHLDWEDFDLLSVAGQQVASYLAEQAGQEALQEATQFDEFNRRMAFVMHDIKNLSSQMSLLLRNAEKHLDNPEFRKDMLLTLRNSSEKLNAMLARLGRYTQRGNEVSETFDLVGVLVEMRTRFAGVHPVTVEDSGPCRIVGDREALVQALAHLVQNAIDASEAGHPVRLTCRTDGLRGECSIIDTGTGMTASFVRNDLFKPFVSSKSGGFGIGAYEARAMIRAMGGRLGVESREGAGTRFTISLPLASASDLAERRKMNSDNAESEIV